MLRRTMRHPMALMLPMKVREPIGYANMRMQPGPFTGDAVMH